MSPTVWPQYGSVSYSADAGSGEHYAVAYPEWADKLRAVDPGLLLQFLESPWFVANIKPRIQPYMDKFLGSKTAGASDVNPFLKELVEQYL